MLKTAGMLLWFCAAGGFGFAKAYGLYRRVNRLQQWLAALEDLACCLRTSGGERQALFHRCFEAKHLVRQSDTQVFLSGDGLCATDFSVLQPFLQSFGWRDAVGELQHIERTVEQLQKNLCAAEQAWAQKGKIFITAGFCAGLGGCLLLG